MIRKIMVPVSARLQLECYLPSFSSCVLSCIALLEIPSHGRTGFGMVEKLLFLQAKLLNLASLIQMEAPRLEDSWAYGITCRNHKELYGWPTERTPFPFLTPPLEFLPLKKMVSSSYGMPMGQFTGLLILEHLLHLQGGW